MNKAGEKWFRKVCLNARHVPSGAQYIDVAEFWTECFYFAVVHKARVQCVKHNALSRDCANPPCDHCLARALAEHVNDTRKMFRPA